MLKTDAINHFGSAANLARALGRTRSAVTQWGAILPFTVACHVEKLSGGKLKADVELYEIRKVLKDQKTLKTRIANRIARNAERQAEEKNNG